MKEINNINKNLDDLIHQQEDTSKKLEVLHNELHPLMLKDNNTNEELVKINDLLTQESELINKDHEIKMDILNLMDEDIKNLEEKYKNM